LPTRWPVTFAAAGWRRPNSDTKMICRSILRLSSRQPGWLRRPSKQVMGRTTWYLVQLVSLAPIVTA